MIFELRMLMLRLISFSAAIQAMRRMIFELLMPALWLNSYSAAIQAMRKIFCELRMLALVLISFSAATRVMRRMNYPAMHHLLSLMRLRSCLQILYSVG
eukprot:6125404-Karenia_brevis.AAC.1